MKVQNLFGRWAQQGQPLRRAPQNIATTGLTTGNLLSTILNPVTTAKTTQAAQTTQQDDTTDAAPTTTTAKATTTAADKQTTNTPSQQTTTSDKTTQQTTTTAPSTSKKASSTLSTVSTGSAGSTTVAVVTETSAPTDGSAPTTIASMTTSSTSSRPTGNNGSFSGIKASQVGMAVGIVAGIAGGFALIVFGIFFWRRHKRRQQMERLGSMEELHRAPSPPLLSRSLTRGAQGPRQPIDDDDDFLTPMDTLPNTHRMDDMNHNDHNDYGDDKSIYDNDEYYENDAQQLNPAFPVPPPAAVVPANGRFYSGDPALVRPGTAGSGNNSSGTIPTYSSMSKYTAYSPTAGGAAASPPSTNPFSSAASVRTSSYSNTNSFSRPGAYRNYGDSHQQPYA